MYVIYYLNLKDFNFTIIIIYEFIKITIIYFLNLNLYFM